MVGTPPVRPEQEPNIDERGKRGRKAALRGAEPIPLPAPDAATTGGPRRRERRLPDTRPVRSSAGGGAPPSEDRGAEV